MHPYLKEVLEIKSKYGESNIIPGPGIPWCHFGSTKYLVFRDLLVRKYSWAILDAKALSCIRRYSPLLSIGCGTGYNEMLLRVLGADVVATDVIRASEEDVCYWMDDIQIMEGTVAVEEYPDRTLFFCWPSYDQSWAYHTLIQYEGQYVIYVGESKGGCTADDRFHDILNLQWEVIETLSIPRWSRIHDYLRVYKRCG